MDNGISLFITTLLAHLPLLVVYGAGLVMALRRQDQLAQQGRRAVVALAVLVLNVLLMAAASAWLVNFLYLLDMSNDAVIGIFSWVSIAGNLVNAVAIWVLLRIIFPAGAGPRPNWQRRVAGALLGLVAGILLALVLGNPIGALLGIGDFEGARGYFVVFLLVPLFAVIGIIVGALAFGRRSRPAES